MVQDREACIKTGNAARCISVFTIRHILSLPRTAAPPADLIYVLADDYSALLRLRDAFRGRVEIRTAQTIFHRKLRELKTPFLEMCRQTERRNPPEVYWRTHLASRHSAALPFLKHVAYLACADEIMANAGDRPVAFVVTSPVLARTIVARARARAVPSQLHHKPFELGNAGLAVRMAAQSVAVIARLLLDWVRARAARLPHLPDIPADAEWTCIRSWVTAGSLGQTGVNGRRSYHDRNFGTLPQYLTQHGRRVVMWPMLFNLPDPDIDVLKDLARTGLTFLFQERYLHLSDYFAAFVNGWREAAVSLDGLEWDGTSLQSIAREAHWSRCFSLSLTRLNLCDATLDRLRQKGVRFETFLYPIENNAPEKPFIRAVRRAFPRARLRGFQHTVWLKEQFGMTLLPGEDQTHPLPDQIMCSGPRYLQVLAGENFPPERLRLGANLRYVNVHKYAVADCIGRPGGVTSLLVILNFEWSQVRELLGELAEARRSLPPIDVRIKSHPLLNDADLRRYLRGISFGPHELVTGRVQDLALASDCVLMTGGSVSSLEVLALGVPLVSLSLANSFDFSCVWEDDPIFEFVDSGPALVERLRCVIEQPDDTRRRFAGWAPAIRRAYFEPVTPSTLKAFL